MLPEPKDYHDWTVHALNIHGAVFERWVRMVLERTPEPWALVASQYPVEYPPPFRGRRGAESVLDVWAEYRQGDRWLSLLMESKKSDPRFVDWVFFPLNAADLISVTGVEVVTEKDTSSKAVRAVRVVDMDARTSQAPVADVARETRGTYEDHKLKEFTRTSTKAIDEASYQVALATQAIIQEQMEMTRQALKEGQGASRPWTRRLFLPSIVTTANLLLAEFDAGAIDGASGTIDYGQVRLRKVEWIWYLYPLPRHLQFAAEGAHWLLERGLADLFTKIPIAVISSSYLERFLIELPTHPHEWVRADDAPEVSGGPSP
jgi:hypothetical protein